MFNNGIPFNWPADRAMTYIKNCMVDYDFNLADACNEAVSDAERYMNECANLGTAVHDAISESFKTGVRSDEASPEAEIVDDFIYRKLINNAWKWIDKFHVDPILVEAALSNERWAGTLDLYCEVDSEAFETKRWCKKYGKEFPQPHRRVKALIDWKCTNSFGDDMPIKLSGYWDLLVEYGYRPDVMFIGRFSKGTGSLNVKDYTPELADSRITFDLACQLFHHNFKDYLNELEQEATRQCIAKKGVQKAGNDE
jgi:hypothetical protein